MTPQKRTELTQKMAEYGLSVMLTRDYDSLLTQLASLAQFERVMLSIAECNPAAAGMVSEIRSEQRRFTEPTGPARQMTVLDIPGILRDANQALHTALDRELQFRPELLPVATALFSSILCREV